jgi:hypothetical protein
MRRWWLPVHTGLDDLALPEGYRRRAGGLLCLGLRAPGSRMAYGKAR